MKAGVLGGTFNPIHLGHLRAAEEIAEELDLEKVYLIPSGMPPHKSLQSIPEFSHRLEMARLATNISPFLDVWDIEGRRPGFSYSVETLRSFHSFFGPGLELFFIIGIDAFMEIESWKEYVSLFNYTSFVVVTRPGYNNGKISAFIDSLNIDLAWDFRKNYYCHPSGNVILNKEITLIDISSSKIRNLLSKGKSIRFLVPESVRDYIKEKGLYSANEFIE